MSEQVETQTDETIESVVDKLAFLALRYYEITQNLRTTSVFVSAKFMAIHKEAVRLMTLLNNGEVEGDLSRYPTLKAFVENLGN